MTYFNAPFDPNPTSFNMFLDKNKTSLCEDTINSLNSELMSR